MNHQTSVAVVISVATVIHTIQVSTKTLLDNWMASHGDILPDMDPDDRRDRIAAFAEGIHNIIEGNVDPIRELFHDGYTTMLVGGAIMEVLDQVKVHHKALARLEIVPTNGKKFFVNDEDLQW